LWLHSLKVAQLLRSAACLHTNQSRSYLNHLVHGTAEELGGKPVPLSQGSRLIPQVKARFFVDH